MTNEWAPNEPSTVNMFQNNASYITKTKGAKNACSSVSVCYICVLMLRSVLSGIEDKTLGFILNELC